MFRCLPTDEVLSFDELTNYQQQLPLANYNPDAAKVPRHPSHTKNWTRRRGRMDGEGEGAVICIGNWKAAT